MEWLSAQISFEELTATRTVRLLEANRRLARAPLIRESLLRVAQNLLQPLRDHFESPLIITSGFRCQELNDSVGSLPTSQHLLGEAADFTILGVTLDAIDEWLRRSGLFYGQCIVEHREWIHLSLPREGKPNRQHLVATLEGGKTVYHAA